MTKIIRVRKEDSAYLYAVLESYEGIAAFSTLDFNRGDLHRDLELLVPQEFVQDIDALLERLNLESEGMIYEFER